MTLLEMTLVLGLLATLALQPLLGWRQQRQRVLLEQESLELLSFLSRAQSLAAFYGRTIVIHKEEPSKAPSGAQSSLWADLPAANFRLVNGEPKLPHRHQTSIHFTPCNSTLTQGSRMLDHLPIFYGLNGTARPTHLQLQSGLYQIRIVISGKGRLSRCSPQGNISTLRRCHQ